MKRHLPVIALAVGMLLAGTFLAFYLHQEVREQVLSQFSESQLLIARQAAEDIESYLEVRSQDVRLLASLTSLQHLDAELMPSDIQASFARLKTAHVTSIIVVDAGGRVVCSTPGNAAGSDYTASDVYAWAKKPANKGMVRVAMERLGSVPRLSLAMPLYRPSAATGRAASLPSTFSGALLLTVDLNALAQQSFSFAPATEAPHRRSTWAMDADGTLLLQAAHPEMVLQNIRHVSGECTQCHASFDYAERMLAAKQGTVDYQLIGQPSKIAAFAPMRFENASWIVVVNASKDDVTGFIRTNFFETMGLVGLVGLVVGLAFLSVYRSVRQEIAEKARHLAEKEKLVGQLRETGEYLESLFAFANAPIIVWDPQLRITRFNRASERLTGHAAGDLIGQELRLLFPEESRENSLSKIVYALGSEDRESPEIPILRKDGGIRITLWNAANIRSGDGAAVIATIAQGQDITERKQTEQMKADFVSFATHQLRTPLTGIRWLLELAGQEEGLPEEAASFFADAQASAERLITLVNDLLAVSRIEGGQLAVRPQPVDLAAVTADVVSELTPLVREKNLQLTVSDTGSVPPAYADPQLARQVLLNLLSNAIKYTRQDGSIAVSMKVDGKMVRWAVRDTGIGVPPEAQCHLFEKFYRAENATVWNTEGSGLGLYLVRLVVERSGGHVSCESGGGPGSTFAFTLPTANTAAPQNEGR